jgi:hypothetical protein
LGALIRQEMIGGKKAQEERKQFVPTVQHSFLFIEADRSNMSKTIPYWSLVVIGRIYYSNAPISSIYSLPFPFSLSRLRRKATKPVTPKCAKNANVLYVNPLLNLGASTTGYVNKGNRAFTAYPLAFITPRTTAHSSASPPQISFAQDIASGPNGTAAL